jgi:hypothetical protein
MLLRGVWGGAHVLSVAAGRKQLRIRCTQQPLIAPDAHFVELEVAEGLRVVSLQGGGHLARVSARQVIRARRASPVLQH